MILTNLNACTEAKDWLCFLGHLQCHLDIDKRQEKTKTIEDISKQKSKINYKRRRKFCLLFHTFSIVDNNM